MAPIVLGKCESCSGVSQRGLNLPAAAVRWHARPGGLEFGCRSIPRELAGHALDLPVCQACCPTHVPGRRSEDRKKHLFRTFVIRGEPKALFTELTLVVVPRGPKCGPRAFRSDASKQRRS